MSSAASHVARVVEKRDADGGMMLVALAVPDAARDSYVRPGQYAEVALASESGYFALGNRERTSPWEILLRRGGGVADRIWDAREGTNVVVSSALGRGFPVESARGEDALVVVTAGAFAAARATIARRVADGDGARTRLLVGARTVESVPLRDEIDAMRVVCVEARIVLSKSAEPRYVQHALAEMFTPRAWVFIAGADAMISDVRAAARALGALDDRVVANV